MTWQRKKELNKFHILDIIGNFGKSIPFLIMVINVYSQYFKAEAIFSGVERRGALVMLISDSEAG